MAATNYFVSVPNREVISGDDNNAGIDFGASSSASDFIELRIMTNTGSASTGVTKLDVVRALEVFKRWIIEGGQTTGTDSGLPIL